MKLLFTLNKSGFIELQKGNIDSIVNITLNKSNVPKDFFNKNIFNSEYNNIKRFKSIIKRLSILTLTTMLEKIYEKQGIDTWAV